MHGDTQGDTAVQGDTGGYGRTLPTRGALEEYADQRFFDGKHLFQQVLRDLETHLYGTKNADELAQYYARNHSFFMAYIADCVSRMQDGIN